MEWGRGRIVSRGWEMETGLGLAVILDPSLHSWAARSSHILGGGADQS